MSGINVYYQHSAEICAPEAGNISVVLGENTEIFSIEDAVQRAAVDRKFRRGMRYPESLENQITTFLEQCRLQLKLHCFDRLNLLNGNLTLKAVYAQIRSLSNRFSRAYLELCKNSFQHAHLGNPRLPIRVDMSLVGTRDHSDDEGILRIADCGKGVDSGDVLSGEEAAKRTEDENIEGGLGNSYITGSMEKVDSFDLGATDPPFRYMVVCSRSLFGELFPGPVK